MRNYLKEYIKEGITSSFITDDLVSVCITTYNRANYLKRSIASILAQSYNNIEIIVVDDGSLDNTKEVLEEYKQLYSNIKTFYNRHNFIESRNKSYELATGKYIANMDDDDISDIYRIEKQYKYILENNLDGCGTVTDIDNVPTDDIKNYYNSKGWGIIFGTFMFKRECLKKFNKSYFLPEFVSGHEDTLFIGQLINFGYKLGNINENLYIRDKSSFRNFKSYNPNKNVLINNCLEYIWNEYANEKTEIKTAIVAAIKNEQLYLEEWIEYHLNLGFDAILLFEDYGSESHKEITDKYDKVYLSSFKKEGIYDDRHKLWGNRQYELYSKELNKYRGIYDWIAFIDIDEFIHLDENITINDFLKEYSGYSGLYLYWKIYNADGKIKYENKPVQERFKNITENIMNSEFAWFCKSIVNLNAETSSLRTIHHVNEGVNTLKMKSDRIMCYHRAHLKHYFTKSWEEWCNRFLNRGDIANNYRKVEYFFHINDDLFYMKDELMKEYNKKLAYKEFMNDRDFEWKIYLQISDNLAGIQISKCGCTTLAYLAVEHKGLSHTNFDHNDAKDLKNTTYKGKCFAVYRDPVDRFLSFYANQIALDKHKGSKWVAYKDLYFKDIDTILTEIENSINTTEPYYVDQHIRRQSDFYNDNDIDYIVPIEYLDDFLIYNDIDIVPHQNKSEMSKPVLTEEQISRIKKLYANDYKLLNSSKVWTPLKK